VCLKLGGCAVLRAEPDHGPSRAFVARAAGRLAYLLDEQRRPAWTWFEAVLGYDNPRLSQALIEAGEVLEREEWREAGLSTLRWIAGWDPVYDWTIIAFARATARASDLLDRYFWDGLVRTIGALGNTLGSLTKGFDERGINAGVDDATDVARGFGRVIAGRHSGRVQTYLGAIAVGMLGLLILYAWLT